MEKLLIFIKHRFSFLWKIIEQLNGLLFTFFYNKRLVRVVKTVFSERPNSDYNYRTISIDDSEKLTELVNAQREEDIRYFKPHGFDLESIKKQSKVKAFLMMGVFDGDTMVGYFFLRFFASRKCFVGRLIDTEYRGKGIGRAMNKIMYNIAWDMKFRCMSTISKNNKLVMKAHSNNPNVKVVKELQNDYLLVEFLKG